MSLAPRRAALRAHPWWAALPVCTPLYGLLDLPGWPSEPMAALQTYAAIVGEVWMFCRSSGDARRAL